MFVRSVPGSIPARVSIFRMSQNRRRKWPTDRIEDNVLWTRFRTSQADLMKEKEPKWWKNQAQTQAFVSFCTNQSSIRTYSFVLIITCNNNLLSNHNACQRKTKTIWFGSICITDRKVQVSSLYWPWWLYVPVTTLFLTVVLAVVHLVFQLVPFLQSWADLLNFFLLKLEIATLCCWSSSCVDL